MIHISKHSGIYTLEAKSLLNISVERAWDYFSSPKNLQEITPPEMGFQITNKVADKAYSGQIITYNVGVLPGIRTNWVTEITHVEEGKIFVDEQRFGPYSMWHHEHIFEEHPKGVLMTDKVSFKIPLGFLGHIAYWLFVKKQLLGIFDYRETQLSKIFG